MKKYRGISLDYGVNTALIEAYREMQREMELEAEEEADDENMDEVVPVMGTRDDLAAAEDYASEFSEGSEIIELD